MAAFSTVRVLAAVTILTSLVLYERVSAAPAQQDRAFTVDVSGNRTEALTFFSPAPPGGFAAISYNTSGWDTAGGSPCQSSQWTRPPGATGWLWAPGGCAFPYSSVVLRRSFVIPARGVLTARVWFAIHGAGHAYLNGKQIGQSSGRPTLVDVTRMLRSNGNQNVLAFDAASGSDGGGIAYDLRITVSSAQYNTYQALHPSYSLPSVSAAFGAPTPTPVVSGSITTTAQGVGSCLTTQPSTVAAIFTGQQPQSRLSTGWVYGSSQFYQPNQSYVYIVTRLIDLSTIKVMADLPTVAVGNQNFRAVAIASDTTSGDQVIVLPPAAGAALTPLNLTIDTTHNQAKGTTVSVSADSRTLQCLAGYQPTVLGYPLQIASQPIAEIDTVPNNDGADGGVAQDGQGNFLGTIVFMPDTQGLQVPYIIPFTVMQPGLDSLISVLGGRQTATSTQQLIKLDTTNPSSPQLLFTNVSGSTSTGSAQPTAGASGTPGLGSQATPASGASPQPTVTTAGTVAATATAAR